MYTPAKDMKKGRHPKGSFGWRRKARRPAVLSTTLILNPFHHLPTGLTQRESCKESLCSAHYPLLAVLDIDAFGRSGREAAALKVEDGTAAIGGV